MNEMLTSWKSLSKKKKMQLIKHIRSIYPNAHVKDIVKENYRGIVKNKQLTGVAFKL